MRARPGSKRVAEPQKRSFLLFFFFRFFDFFFSAETPGKRDAKRPRKLCRIFARSTPQVTFKGALAFCLPRRTLSLSLSLSDCQAARKKDAGIDENVFAGRREKCFLGNVPSLWHDIFQNPHFSWKFISFVVRPFWRVSSKVEQSKQQGRRQQGRAATAHPCATRGSTVRFKKKVLLLLIRRVFFSRLFSRPSLSTLRSFFSVSVSVFRSTPFWSKGKKKEWGNAFFV